MSHDEAFFTARCPRCGLIVSGETWGDPTPCPVTAWCLDCHEFFEAHGPPDGPNPQYGRRAGAPYDWSEEVAAHNRERSAQLQFELDGGF
ncbi:MAG: hypothetical protein DLM66_12845 [Candidatus Dormiibacter spiritus]|nr:MAG: hypothetical protein DLM66_12845 [Candidatus Dormibacteraeota bacterium]